MKKILIAASAVGAAAAGLILYMNKKNKSTVNAGNVIDAASDAHQAMDNTLHRVERPAQHAMG